jgi:hypothetical protein
VPSVSVELPEPEEWTAWLDPADVGGEGFGRSRVLMMNEAHNGLARRIRTREIGRRLYTAPRGCSSAPSSPGRGCSSSFTSAKDICSSQRARPVTMAASGEGRRG